MSAKLLDGHDYDELEALLDAVGGEQNLGLDGVHGLLSALAVGPGEVSADDWLPLALGKHPRAIVHPQLDRCIELLLNLHESIEYALDHYAYEPVLMEHQDADGDCEVDHNGWCIGFAAGIDLLGDDWEDALCSDAGVIAAASALQALGVTCDPFTRCLAQPETSSDYDQEALLQRLPNCLIELRHYWEEPRDEHQSRRHRLH